MKNIRVPSFLSNFRDKGLIVGYKEDGDSFYTRVFYVKGIHPGLMEFASVRFLNNGWSGEPETEVTVYSIRPAVTFMVYDVMEKVA